MSYATDDNSGPVGYVKLTASGPNGRRPARPGVGSRRCELDPARQLLLLGRRGSGSAAGAEAVEQSQHRPALREQGGAQGRERDRQPQRVAPLRFGPDAGGLVLERLLHDLWAELRQVGHVDHARVHPRREVLEGRQMRRVPAQQPAACAVTSTTRLRSASRPRTARCRPSRRACTTASRIPLTATADARATTGRRRRLTASQFFKDPADGGYDFTNDPRYVTLIITDNTAFSSSNTAEPVKYFAGFYATGWDTGNGSGKPKGCYGFPLVGTCGNPEQRRPPPPRLSRREHHEQGQRRHVGPLRQVRHFLLERHAERRPMRPVERQRRDLRRGPRRVAAAPGAIPCHDDRRGPRLRRSF